MEAGLRWAYGTLSTARFALFARLPEEQFVSCASAALTRERGCAALGALREMVTQADVRARMMLLQPS